MNYQTFEPDEALSPLIKCYWTLEGPKEKTPEKQTIVPDGCMELIFHYGDLYRQYADNGHSLTQPRCFAIGQLTRPLEIEPTGETGIFSVRFHPGGFLPFTSIPLRELENKAVPLEKVFAQDGKGIEQMILEAKTTSQRIELLEQFFLNRLKDRKTIDRTIKATVGTILTAYGQLSVDEISKRTNIHRRQLERKFRVAIGLSPKQLSKTIRLQAALSILLAKKFTSLTALAYETGYYDQAHFIKDFKELTGFTPKEFYGSQLKLSSLFYGRT